MRFNIQSLHKNIDNLVFFKNPEKIFILLSIFFGITFLTLLPLCEAPDEPAHFFRAYELSDFKNNGNSIAYLPVSLSYIVSPLTKDWTIPGNPNQKFDIRVLFSLWNYPLNENIKQWTWPSPAYPFVMYIPQIIGIEIGKIFNESPIILWYLGRFFNFLAWMSLSYLAIKITPVGKWLFLILALMPMSLSQAASISPDAVINGLAFILIALFLYYSLDPNKKTISQWDMVLLIVFSTVLVVSKQAYCLIPLLFLIIPVSKFYNKQDFILKFCLLIFSIILVNALFSFSTSQSIASVASSQINTNIPRPGYTSVMQSQITQLSFVIHDPLGYCSILLKTLSINNNFYIHSFIGIFGWLDTHLPTYVYYLFIGLLIVVSVFEFEQAIHITAKQKGLFLLIFAITFFIIFTGLWITWTPPGSSYVEGVQGRYLIPIAPLLFLILHNDKKIIDEFKINLIKIVVITLLVYVLFASVQTLYLRYYSEPIPLGILGGLICGVLILQILIFKLLEIVDERHKVKSKTENHSDPQSKDIILKPITVCCSLTIIFAIILVTLTGTGNTIGISQPVVDQPVGEIIKGITVGQTFYSPQPDLTSIDVDLATYARTNTKDVLFHLRDSPESSNDIVTIQVNAQNIMDNSNYEFKFPPIEDSANKSYYFFIDSPESVTGNAITIWSSKNNTYSLGSAYINSEPINGDLTFSVNYALQLQIF